MSEIQLKKRSRKASFTRRPHRTLLRLLYSSGLRMGETLSPPPADIKKDKGLIYIQGGKESKDRRVPPSSQYLTELRKFYKGHQPGQYFFEGQNRLGNMKIKGKNMTHNMPNGNVIGVKYAYIN